MGGCASKPKEFDTARPEALPTESTRPEKADREAETTTDSTNVAANQEAVDTTNVEAEAPLVDLSEPKEKEEEAAPVVVPAAAAEAKPEAAAAAEVAATQKPKEEKVADQVEVAARQLAEVNLVEAVKETKEKELLPAQEIKPKAKEEQPAAAIKPKAKEEEPAADIKPKAAPASEGKNKDAPILTV
ncbi:PREDICTED: major latex allergen Hev b 5 [Prunus mume]|uniref:Major latex allergen Hev b 5 n=1 Tax=Prunus mume TaxID=102107 RepID=A0ABM0P613_PRUMU|nr:PREDICTED: major latex allergen Hev b 5 [Prunus mume]